MKDIKYNTVTFIILSIMLTLGVISCASNTNLHDETQKELKKSADTFYQAIVDHDPKTVYDLLSANTQIHMNFTAFQPYFEENYDLFLDYATQMKYQINSGSFELMAIPKTDPCGDLRLILNDDGQWIVPSTPSMNASETINQRKQYILNLIRSQSFIQSLSEYSIQHPKLTMTQIREIRRHLLSLGFEDVAIMANHAIITMDDLAIIQLSCVSQQWRLSQCSFLR